MHLTPHGKTQNQQVNRPIFIERSGIRRKVLRSAAIALGGACGAYLIFAALLVAGFWQPAGQQGPPGTGASFPTAPGQHEAGRSHGGTAGEEVRLRERSPSARPDPGPSPSRAGGTRG
ncbi:hypothetical protein EES43_29515 [Streptomyces sp. ADI96-02]|uniref:hypothetical protein n=1 Tax=Streptomyces sp. ADI96-02 TaxID=1522760 RepID=UPI000F54F941|nr:hypothetical protein [Streptomyces sp. ADI96-02]RPK54118.1 hypothetical protein EES43_29515 [Streptomyces sp. ADI96-02]